MAYALQEYIESSYHLRDETLIAERRAMLQSPGVIFQEPFIEATPFYKAERTFSQLRINEEIKSLFAAAGREKNVSIFDPPYSHQAEALEAVLNDDDDLIVSTGTGSGKTETFLFPILASLFRESREKPTQNLMTGARAIVLYPMNALVNDQLFRLRKLLYKSEFAARLAEARGRKIRFAAYTGRMPYPGRRDSGKDTRYIAPIFDEFYLPLLKNLNKRALLEGSGRWPAKDLESFYRADLREDVIRKRKGVEIDGNAYHWDKRLITQLDDAELFTRDEVLKACPDILITNYSMLEYMLIRPIERPIFEQTRAWLHSSPENRLTLVIDEAHLYRGAAGAEIAMLLRRLMARLDVRRERIRCIITSASIGEGDRGIEVAFRFAEELTGSPVPRRFRYIGSSLDLPSVRGLLEREDQASLAACKVELINVAAQDSEPCDELERLAQLLRWPKRMDEQPISEYLYDILVTWAPVGTLIEQVTRAGTTSTELIRSICGDKNESAVASVAALLELCSLAKRDGRVLLPARVHLFFRGLPGIWACVNPRCDARRVQHDAPYKLGRFYDAPRAACECSKHARVFELLSHRDCGAAFVQAFMDSVDGDFLWSEGGELPDDVTRKLIRVELLIDGSPHSDFPEALYERANLDVVSGKVIREGAGLSSKGLVQVFLPRSLSKNGHLEFSACPVCQQSWRADNSRIERHNTRGENPFVAVLREQLERQPLAKLRPDQEAELSRYPNRGRKALVFSDGRQRAARLARVVPEVIAQDAFRQTLCRAVALRSSHNLEARLDNKLYTTFVKVCSEGNIAMFDGESRSAFRQQIREVADKDLEDLLDDDTLEDRVSGYGKMLYWALSNPYYSLHVLGIAYVVSTRQVMPRISQDVERLGDDFISENLEALITMWIRAGLREYVFDRKIDAFYRQVVSSTPKEIYSGDGLTAPTLRKKLLATQALSQEALASLEAILKKHLMELDANGNAFLKPSSLALRVAVDTEWYRCPDCQACHPVRINRLCAECYSASPETVGAESPYMMSRKDLWRRPVRRTINGHERPVTFLAAEHTAQLSHRDRAEAHATTELHELRFQDILIGDNDEPIDVLSSTTTMEVGIDIGSLVAVAMRNIPPERANYQQRAGRAGRRGSGLSTVMAFAELMPHDAFYFANPDKIVRGAPRTPEIKISNPKIAARHVNAYVFQRFFSGLIDRGFDGLKIATGLAESFGKTEAFFHDDSYDAGFKAFSEWLRGEIQDDRGIVAEISSWLPQLNVDVSLKDWVSRTCRDLLAGLEESAASVPRGNSSENVNQGEDEELREDENVVRRVPAQLLDFLGDSGFLPTYALPRHVASFLVERYEERNGYRTVRAKEMPQQELRKALSEYAPGRIVTVNGVDYRSGAVTAATPFTVHDRAKRLFDEAQRLLTCTTCDFVRMVEGGSSELCPICLAALVPVEMIKPEVFLPDDVNGVPENDRRQERTYVTGAQLPLPVDEDHLPEFSSLGFAVASTYAPSQELITLNRGPERRGERAGFWVCELCGQAELDRPQNRHKRAYRPEGKIASPFCNGQHRNTLLGQVFRTDLLVLRFTLKPPVINKITSGLERYLLHSAFETISQALIIAASRHRDIDVDSQEFGSGYRFLPRIGDTMRADVYLYDTLEGGAGFSEIAHARIGEIAHDVIQLLESCPANCARSCTGCLRHFKNQHVTARLDRRLAAALLRSAFYGNASLEELDTDPNLWSTLSRILETDGLQVEPLLQGLRVSRAGKSLDVYAYKPVLEEESGQNIVRKKHGSGALAFNEIFLVLDPPNVHAAIRARLPGIYTIYGPDSIVSWRDAHGPAVDVRIIAPVIDRDGELGYRCKELVGDSEQVYKHRDILIVGEDWYEARWDPVSETIA